ncbi:MAG: hypothetical protein AB1571_02300 [Nanoarchaeota archaeon]
MGFIVYEGLLDVVLDKGGISLGGITKAAQDLGFDINNGSFMVDINTVLRFTQSLKYIRLENGKYHKNKNLENSSKTLLNIFKKAPDAYFTERPWLSKLKERLELKYGSS